MQFDRDEYILLSRRGRVPQARSKGPPRYEAVARRRARSAGPRRLRRPRTVALLTALGIRRAAMDGRADAQRRVR